MTKTLLKQFPYEYISCGYWRKKDIPKDTPAPILHGEQVIEEVIEWMQMKLLQEKE